MEVLSFEQFIKLYEENKEPAIKWFILSFDVINLGDRETKYKTEFDDSFRKGILNILVQNQARTIKSIVATTICFSSLQDLEYWKKVLNDEASPYIYFHMGKVVDRTSIIISPNTNQTFIQNFNNNLAESKQKFEERKHRKISVEEIYN
jgi:hypothetical protein